MLVYSFDNLLGAIMEIDESSGVIGASRQPEFWAKGWSDGSQRKTTRVAQSNKADFSDLIELFLYFTLTLSPELSHGKVLIDIAKTIMEKNGIAVESLLPVDHAIVYGVYPDITEQSWEQDDWPEIKEKRKVAELLVIMTQIWLGEKSCVCTKVVECSYSPSGDFDAHG